ncbi:MAG: hypothetical protein ABIQ08_06270 [Duganella sp.]
MKSPRRPSSPTWSDDSTLAVARELGVDYAQGCAVGRLRPLSVG